jgi:hypothetical protein
LYSRHELDNMSALQRDEFLFPSLTGDIVGLQYNEFLFLSLMTDIVCSCNQSYSTDGFYCIFCSKVFANKLAFVNCNCNCLLGDHLVEFCACPKCERISLGQENTLKFIKLNSLYMRLLQKYNGVLSEATVVNFL